MFPDPTYNDVLCIAAFIEWAALVGLFCYLWTIAGRRWKQRQLTFEPPNTGCSGYAILRDALQNDVSYAWGWLCNIAMAAYDEGVDHATSNRLANRFMQVAFGVDLSNDPQYLALQAHWDQRAEDDNAQFDDNPSYHPVAGADPATLHGTEILDPRSMVLIDKDAAGTVLGIEIIPPCVPGFYLDAAEHVANRLLVADKHVPGGLPEEVLSAIAEAFPEKFPDGV